MNSKMKDIGSGLRQAAEYWDVKSSSADSFLESVEQNSRPQKMRYESFVRAHDLENCSVLDVGCGAGDFYRHLHKREINSSYTGTDISSNMVSACRNRFPGQIFRHVDIVDLPDNEAYDYVVSFGIHNIRVDNGWEILQALAARQFQLCKKAAHVSILTDRYEGFAPHIQSWNAERVLSLALSITPCVVLRHDYLPNDFSVTLYREPLIDTQDNLLIDYD